MGHFFGEGPSQWSPRRNAHRPQIATPHGRTVWCGQVPRLPAQVLGDRSLKVKHLNRHALLLASGAVPGSASAGAAPESLHLQVPPRRRLVP